MKRRLLTLLIAIFAILLCVTACSEEVELVINTNDLVKIEIVSGVPATCYIGEAPDFSALKVTATYEDGSIKELGVNDVTISTIDTTTVKNSANTK